MATYLFIRHQTHSFNGKIHMVITITIKISAIKHQTSNIKHQTSNTFIKHIHQTHSFIYLTVNKQGYFYSFIYLFIYLFNGMIIHQTHSFIHQTH